VLYEGQRHIARANFSPGHQLKRSPYHLLSPAEVRQQP
jgi:hypothetical protein